MYVCPQNLRTPGRGKKPLEHDAQSSQLGQVTPSPRPPPPLNDDVIYGRFPKLKWFALNYVCSSLKYNSKRSFFFMKKPHSGIKKWQLISVSFLLFRFRQTYTRNGNETSPRQGKRKKELIILIKSIFNMEKKNKLRTSNENPATQNKIIRKNPKETSFWLFSTLVPCSCLIFLCFRFSFHIGLEILQPCCCCVLHLSFFLHLKLLKTRILL